ncbi:glycoside hydrolase family 1 protein [Candidatus Parcubacteria bacterium]|nr:MAG: glycoside hydrolase family 1 protein [Candidatus Parcubacteria bacterium]
MAVLKFPDGFLWGAATSAHQVEGGNRNDWTEWEKANAERLAKKAAAEFSHLKNWPEIRPQAENPANYISGRACDHYNRFREDFDIARGLGHNAHRFSIEWSRIEPEKGTFDEQAIEHYRQVIRALRERGIEPFASLWHWTNPVWIAQQGGWENEKTLSDFERFVSFVAKALGAEVNFWIPLNEPTVFAGHGYVLGAFPPQVKSYWRANRVLKNLENAHQRAYRVLHAAGSAETRVGSVFNFHFHTPHRPKFPLDILMARLLDYFRDLRPLRRTTDFQDFIGLNYYFRDTIRFVPWGGRFGPIDVRNPNQWVSDMGWDIYPDGLRHVLRMVGEVGKPIYVTENGIADASDQSRSRFIRDHIRAMAGAMQDGVDIRGYLHWSLLDNFEWDKGFWPRFGLVEIDYQTLERKIRQSAWDYKKIIDQNAI